MRHWRLLLLIWLPFFLLWADGLDAAPGMTRTTRPFTAQTLARTTTCAAAVRADGGLLLAGSFVTYLVDGGCGVFRSTDLLTDALWFHPEDARVQLILRTEVSGMDGGTLWFRGVVRERGASGAYPFDSYESKLTTAMSAIPASGHLYGTTGVTPIPSITKGAEWLLAVQANAAATFSPTASMSISVGY